MDQLVTVVQVTGYSRPLTRMLLTSMGAEPTRVNVSAFVLISFPLLLVTEKARVQRLQLRGQRRATLAEPVLHRRRARQVPSIAEKTPFATSDWYLASMTGLQLAPTSGPSTAFLIVR